MSQKLKQAKCQRERGQSFSGMSLDLGERDDAESKTDWQLPGEKTFKNLALHELDLHGCSGSPDVLVTASGLFFMKHCHKLSESKKPHAYGLASSTNLIGVGWSK